MNIDRTNALADLIESLPHTTFADENGFFMGNYVHDCGTPSCMAGWAAWEYQGRPNELSFPEKPRGSFRYKSLINDAIAYLEIPADKVDLVKNELFRGHYSIFESSSITPAQAARTLRHFATSGEVNWTI